jgi:hypothetical protein
LPEWVTKYWVEWLFGLVIAILTAAYKRLSTRFKKEREERLAKARKDKEEMDGLKNGVRALLSDKLIENCEISERNGFCRFENKESIKDMYACYHVLGGNGIVKDMVDSVLALPTQKRTNITEGES